MPRFGVFGKGFSAFLVTSAILIGVIGTPGSATIGTVQNGSTYAVVPSGYNWGNYTYFSTQRSGYNNYDSGPGWHVHWVHHKVTSFTSSNDRYVTLRPLKCSSWSIQQSYGITQAHDYELGGWEASHVHYEAMKLYGHCWRYTARVDPGRDTNGWGFGDGNTTIYWEMSY